MQRKDKAVLIKMSESERKTLKRKAKKLGMTVSEYVRTALIHSDNLNITMIDITPLEKVATELQKQGVNLNQLMKFLNTYGADVYNADETLRALTREGDLYLKVSDAIAQLREEAERHHVYITDCNFEDAEVADEDS